MKAIKYVILYLLIIQIFLGGLIPLSWGYTYRMDYELVKDNLSNIDIILEKISTKIKKENIQEYIVVLGDSVGYSGPCSAYDSIGANLQNIAQENGRDNLAIFNLSMPAMQTGDIYTMILKLKEHNISTENLIVNLIYAGFVNRNPDPPSVFWLKDELKRLDQESFTYVLPNLEANQYRENKKTEFKASILNKISLFKYKDFLKKKAEDIYKRETPHDPMGDARPWNEKEGLAEALQTPEYLLGFAPEPFVMTQENPQIYFIDKIIEQQKDKNTLIYLAGTNEVLMNEQVNTLGYQNNLKSIDNYFQYKPIKLLNLQNEIPEKYFTDHVHLTQEGYQKLASILWRNFNKRSL
ncbi:hypothetical protein SAMN00017405_1827 [Desulfonispora thiosulfatigenes DSM 11270]|uniref:GDSL-like Lipase/Acylhydrolase family protein n=1 Tax=Desulfonispora thiosulfatigenes DSM 11270 TaxID=656914 RepID=A0A1W1V4U6_DESTI|nr:hypothetical protein [Desulfonispora thiosulfatigenes]SMB88061.1 hypothetical protein SAMN00017405_1827 [Desulfonispora thiosulfatigenes DSM 11270]